DRQLLSRCLLCVLAVGRGDIHLDGDAAVVSRCAEAYRELSRSPCQATVAIAGADRSRSGPWDFYRHPGDLLHVAAVVVRKAVTTCGRQPLRRWFWLGSEAGGDRTDPADRPGSDARQLLERHHTAV